MKTRQTDRTKAGPHFNGKSLEEVHGSVETQHPKLLKRMFAFAGPAYLVSVGYMDPGNWATDLEGGSRFGYALVWVILMSNMMAVLLQTLSARLGIVTGKDLAQACRSEYSKSASFILWILCEIAIAACDLAEVLGTILGLNLLFGLPLLWGALLTLFDTFLLLAIQRLGIRKMEAFILSLISIIAGGFVINLFLAKPDWGAAVAGLTPSLPVGSLYIILGIIGATVMPHNLYLHSALVQSRKLQQDESSIKRAIKFNTIDSTVALSIAFLVNAAILVLAATVFFGKESVMVADGSIVHFGTDADWIRVAYLTLAPLLGVTAASTLFAVALLASGQSSTITGTLAGQVVMEGFMHWRISPWLRRLITRLLAILPAILIIGIRGDSSVNDLLTLSQVVLALQLPFAMFPLLHFTSSSKRMGKWKNGWFLLIFGWGSALLITVMDLFGLPESLEAAWHVIIGG